MTILSREQILSKNDLAKELIPVPEWGGEVWVRGMTGAERDSFEMDVVEQRGKKTAVNMNNMRAKLCSRSICDEKGKLLFTEADVKGLGEKSAAALSRIFMVAQRLSGITESDVKEMAEELEANPFEDSPTD